MKKSNKLGFVKLEPFEQAEKLNIQIDIAHVSNRILLELENNLNAGNAEVVKQLAESRISELGSLENEVEISAWISQMINTWTLRHGLGKLRALVVFACAIPNNVSGSSVRTVTRYISQTATIEDVDTNELLLVAEAVTLFLSSFKLPFSIQYLTDLLYKECHEVLYIALAYAPILLGQNPESKHRVPLPEVVDALFSQKEFESLAPKEQHKVVSKLVRSMSIQYWGENLAELEDEPSQDIGGWAPRERFLSWALLGEAPLLCVFAMQDDDKTVIAFTDDVKSNVDQGCHWKDAISDVAVRLEETHNLHTPIERKIREGISHSWSWRMELTKNQSVVNLADFRKAQKEEKE